MRAAVTACLGVLAIFIVEAAQQPADRRDPSGSQASATSELTTLAGRVVTGASPREMRPVRRAKVTLTGSGLTSPRITDTDTKGAYRFDRVSPGEYKIAIQKPGFVKVSAAAQPNAVVTMTRGSAIEGVVTDPAGDPIWNVVVSALRDAGEKPQVAAQVRTDDLGRYRLHSLDDGDYIVEAATDARFVQSLILLAGEKRPDVTRSYYPNAAAVTDAKPVRIAAGSVASGINLVLRIVPPATDPSAPPPPPRPDATGTGRIAGRVIDATTGRPIRNARLLLVPVDGQRLTNWTRTSGQGRYEYGSLQARRYTLRAEADRYVTLEFGQKTPADSAKEIELREGEDFGADIALPRTSALDGTILDEFGEPAPNVTVQLARKVYAAGRQRLLPSEGRMQPAVTDDIGHYRVSGVPPGEYFVVALSGVYTGDDGAPGFAPTYYPGSPDAGAAAPIAITAGMDAVATFPLTPAKTVTVSGTMIDAEGKPVAGRGMLWLATPDRLKRMDFTIARGVTAGDGRFALRNVPEGSYTMQGFGPPPPNYKGPMNLGAMPFGWLPVTVGDAALDNLLLRVTNGAALRGRIVLEDTVAAPPKSSEVHVTAIPVEFDSAPVGGGPPPSTTHDDLSFEVLKLSGLRRVMVTISSPDWALKRITFNKMDITDEPVDFRTKDVEDVEVVLTSKVSHIRGRVTDSKGGAVADYVILIFPSDPTKWVDRSRYLLTARPTQNQQFDVHGMPPEEYLVIALPSVDAVEWQDPDFLQRLRPQAASVLLTEGETKTVELTIRKKP